MPTCRFIGRRCGTVVASGGGLLPVMVCHHPSHQTTTDAHCVACADRDETTQPIALREKRPVEPTFWLPDGNDNRPVDLQGLYRGGTAFLVLGGPSLQIMPLDRLAARGVLIASYNNNPAALPPPIRPHIWLHNDKPCKMHDSLWRDPSILKFSPVREWRGGDSKGKYKNVRTRDRDGFHPYARKAVDLPGVIGFTRTSHFDPDRWLSEPSLNNGNCKRSAARNGWPHIINTMFQSLKLLWLLGFDRVYLIGADFRMDPDRPYAFAEHKSEGGVRANNEGFRKMDTMLAALAPRLVEGGMSVYNATPGSGLRAFPTIGFIEAVTMVTENYDQRIDARGWYCD